MPMYLNLTWQGVAIWLFGIVVGIFIGVSSNLITPKFQNWWASRSRASLSKRIEKLEKRQQEWERLDAVTATEEIILCGIQLMLVSFGAGFVSFAAAGVVFNQSIFHSWELQLANLLLLFGSFVAALGAKSVQNYRQPRSPQDREYLKKQIASLKAKLEKK